MSTGFKMIISVKKQSDVIISDDTRVVRLGYEFLSIASCQMTSPAPVITVQSPMPALRFPALEDLDAADYIPGYAAQHSISEEQAATELVLLNPLLVEDIQEADKSLRKGEPLLTYDEVFGT